MSLDEVVRLSHSAECRLNMSASRPDRNLRVVVGHLLHYESLRLRIVTMTHEMDRNQRSQAVQFQSNNEASLRHKPSTEQLGKRSPPPKAVLGELEDDSDEEEDMTDDDDADFDDDGEDDELGLTRYPTNPAPVVRSEEDDDYIMPTKEPDRAVIDLSVQKNSNDEMVKNINSVIRCPCHDNTGAPKIEQLWVLPAQEGDTPDVTRAVAQVAA